MKKTLPFFSYFFHPIFIPIFAAILYFLAVKDRYFNYDLIYLYLIQILIITVFIPLTVFYLLVHYKKVDSIMVSDVSQRRIPLLINVLLMLVLTTKYITKENLPELYFFFIGSIISSLCALLFSFFRKKVSLHMTGISALTVFFSGLFYHYQIKEILILSIIFLCNGLVGSSRLQMKAHNYTELILGFLIGLVPQVLLLSYWL